MNAIIPEQTLNGLIAKHEWQGSSKEDLLKDIKAFQHYLESAVTYYKSMADSVTDDRLKYHYHQRAMVYRRVLTGLPEDVEE